VVFAVRVQVLWELRVSRYNFTKWLILILFILVLLRAVERSGYITDYKSFISAEANCKNHDELMNYTVRVRGRSHFSLNMNKSVLWAEFMNRQRATYTEFSSKLTETLLGSGIFMSGYCYPGFVKYSFWAYTALLCPLTARQYGEVVLPDASTGQHPDTLAAKWSRCKEGMAHFLPSWYKFFWELVRSRYKVSKWPGIDPGSWIWKKAHVQYRGTICLEARNSSRCRNLIACRCACPGATTITNLSWVQE